MYIQCKGVRGRRVKNSSNDKNESLEKLSDRTIKWNSAT